MISFSITESAAQSSLNDDVVDFSFQTEKNSVLLSWNIENLENVHSITVERSRNNLNFVPVFQSYSLDRYEEYRDRLFGAEANSDLLYYRMIVQYKNGKMNQSKSKVIDLLENRVLRPTIYTAPSRINYEFLSVNSSNTVAQIFNTTSRMVKQTEFTANRGKNLMSVDVSDLQSGLYFLRLEQDGKVTTTKFFVR